MSIDMSQFFQVFFEETEELLAEKERLLLSIDLNSPSVEDIDAIFRAAHSIKGGASTFGLTDMTEVTHILESLLDPIRKGEMALTAEHVEAFLTAKDILVMLRDGHRDGADVDLDAVKNIMSRLESLSGISVAPHAAPIHPDCDSASNNEVAGTRLFHLSFLSISEKDLAALAAELGMLGEVQQNIDAGGNTTLHLTTRENIDDIQAICSFILNPEDMMIVEEAVSKAEAALNISTGVSEEEQGYGFFDNIELPAAKENAPLDQQSSVDGASKTHSALSAAQDGNRQAAPRPAVSQESSSIRVSVEKVDQLINLVGELVITQAMLEQRTSTLDSMEFQRLLDSVSQLTRNTRDLQEAVMSIRMMPMDYVFSRFPRMVRDLAGKMGKRIDFVTHGSATELDKGLIERIVDPLTHLVRNSIDHGIEMPDVRAAAGKNEAGKLTLSATHQGGNILIEVSDDGGGLNREKILAKAKQQGLTVSDSMNDSDVWQLIFAPGFSTADAVTDVSGRGVGMDVVKRNITSMGGSVEIRSARGLGTTISIFLPLTLAILDGMSVKAGDEVYILPLGYVIESLKPESKDLKEISGKGKVIKVRGEYLPLVALYQLFSIEPRYTDPSEGLVVILESDGVKAALFIDELLGQQQVVVKNLESNYRKVPGISGATILGDGGVALILDVPMLVRSNRPSNTERMLH